MPSRTSTVAAITPGAAKSARQVANRATRSGRVARSAGALRRPVTSRPGRGRGRPHPAPRTDGLGDRSPGPPGHPRQWHKHAEQDNAVHDAPGRSRPPQGADGQDGDQNSDYPYLGDQVTTAAIRAAQPSLSPRPAAVPALTWRWARSALSRFLASVARSARWHRRSDRARTCSSRARTDVSGPTR